MIFDYSVKETRSRYHLGQRESSELDADWLGQLSSAPLLFKERFARLSHHVQPMIM